MEGFTFPALHTLHRIIYAQGALFCLGMCSFDCCCACELNHAYLGCRCLSGQASVSCLGVGGPALKGSLSFGRPAAESNKPGCIERHTYVRAYICTCRRYPSINQLFRNNINALFRKACTTSCAFEGILGSVVDHAFFRFSGVESLSIMHCF